MELIILSSLEKVFFDEKPSAEDFGGFSMLKNEKSSFQAAFRPENDGSVTVELCGELANYSKTYIVKDVPVGNACFEDADLSPQDIGNVPRLPCARRRRSCC